MGKPGCQTNHDAESSKTDHHTEEFHNPQRLHAGNIAMRLADIYHGVRSREHVQLQQSRFFMDTPQPQPRDLGGGQPVQRGDGPQGTPFPPSASILQADTACEPGSSGPDDGCGGNIRQGRVPAPRAEQLQGHGRLVRHLPLPAEEARPSRREDDIQVPHQQGMPRHDGHPHLRQRDRRQPRQGDRMGPTRSGCSGPT